MFTYSIRKILKFRSGLELHQTISNVPVSHHIGLCPPCVHFHIPCGRRPHDTALVIPFSTGCVSRFDSVLSHKSFFNHLPPGTSHKKLLITSMTIVRARDLFRLRQEVGFHEARLPCFTVSMFLRTWLPICLSVSLRWLNFVSAFSRLVIGRRSEGFRCSFKILFRV